eukprot:TRINITY_DN5449_c0_g1_i3.p1 TRINITY_DN5449_c0_g1~~TRINITY_DN5449_c0_g1_i3.p1  ORF type:complete len:360 (-),score=147.39 TRINITY_DN5449_c0_g1_i3:79-1158(-)
METLARMIKVIKDCCGVVTEESIRKNFVLVYELLDEMIDFGHPQLVSTEAIKPYIVNDPVPVSQNIPSIKPSFITSNTISSVAVQRSVVEKKNQKNEIFVDIFEKISVLFNSSGYKINSSIEGCIQMKSYLFGNPELRLALNDDLVVGKGTATTSGGVVLDDCNFHECVNTTEFDMNRTLRINPPDGEFTVMNYRVTNDFQEPFRLFPFIDEVSTYKLELLLKVRACYPKETYASHAILKFNVPKLTSSVYNEVAKGVQGQKVDYNENTKTVEWVIKKFQGGTEQTLKIKITLQTNANTYAARKEIGPISMSFEIPMYNVSNLQIKYLRIESKEKEKSNHFRWVRYVTQSSSYVCRTQQ